MNQELKQSAENNLKYRGQLAHDMVRRPSSFF